MPDDLRTELEAAAKRRGKNLTDELCGRLLASFAREHEQKRDPATRALCFLISELGKTTHFGARKWHRDPFLFRAFRLAVANLLEALEPAGKLKPPFGNADNATAADQWLVERYKDPETAARHAADITLYLLGGHMTPEQYRPALQHAIATHPEHGWANILENLDREHYRMSDARNALDFKSQKRG
jgi:hypothetical protein